MKNKLQVYPSGLQPKQYNHIRFLHNNNHFSDSRNINNHRNETTTKSISNAAELSS